MSDAAHSRVLAVLIAILAVVMLVIGYGAVRSSADRAIGAAESERDAARKDAAHWQNVAAKASARIRVDTVKLKSWLPRYDATRATVTTDLSAGSSDTAAVHLFVLTADSTVHACRITVADCLTAKLATDSELASVRREMTATERLIPSRTSRLLDAAKWLVIGAASGVLATHVMH